MPKKKKNKFRQILKIIGGIIVFFTLPSLLFFGFLYIRYDKDLPEGQQGEQADQLATQMLNALNYEAYKATDYLEWTFKNKHRYQWHKSDNYCEVFWDDFKVTLDLNNIQNSKVYVAKRLYNGIEKNKYIKKAQKYFNNDSFWLVAPYKVFDAGTERRLVKTEENTNALLVTYTSGGNTPGDSYLWHLDHSGKPKSYQMWVDILPIGGLEASWENWMTTKSEAQFPTLHKFLAFQLEITDIKGTKL